MKFKLDTKIDDFDCTISYENPLFFMGSCFSDEISLKFKNAGFETQCNYSGTIYHPIPLAKAIENIIFNTHIYQKFKHIEPNFSQNDDSILVDCNTNELEINSLKSFHNKLHSNLKNASHLFITFGTSYGYKDVKTNEIVPNCKKLPASNFNKELTSIEEMFIVWEKLITKIKIFNPSIKLFFTVSPVRHFKDGLKENNRSKARLFELISKIEESFSVVYIPTYEIINDELRDYRFFKEDLVHPNDLALAYVWEVLKPSFFNQKTLIIVEEVEQLRKLQHHKILTQNNSEKLKFVKERNEKIKLFLEKNSNVKW